MVLSDDDVSGASNTRRLDDLEVAQNGQDPVGVSPSRPLPTALPAKGKCNVEAGRRPDRPGGDHGVVGHGGAHAGFPANRVVESPAFFRSPVSAVT